MFMELASLSNSRYYLKYNYYKHPSLAPCWFVSLLDSFLQVCHSRVWPKGAPAHRLTLTVIWQKHGLARHVKDSQVWWNHMDICTHACLCWIACCLMKHMRKYITAGHINKVSWWNRFHAYMKCNCTWHEIVLWTLVTGMATHAHLQ